MEELEMDGDPPKGKVEEVFDQSAEPTFSVMYAYASKYRTKLTKEQAESLFKEVQNAKQDASGV